MFCHRQLLLVHDKPITNFEPSELSLYFDQDNAIASATAVTGLVASEQMLDFTKRVFDGVSQRHGA
ncbi:MAG: hypothetical protein ACO2ZD_11985, partial [Pseudomonadales bacterium]